MKRTFGLLLLLTSLCVMSCTSDINSLIQDYEGALKKGNEIAAERCVSKIEQRFSELTFEQQVFLAEISADHYEVAKEFLTDYPHICSVFNDLYDAKHEMDELDRLLDDEDYDIEDYEY